MAAIFERDRFLVGTKQGGEVIEVRVNKLIIKLINIFFECIFLLYNSSFKIFFSKTGVKCFKLKLKKEIGRLIHTDFNN